MILTLILIQNMIYGQMKTMKDQMALYEIWTPPAPETYTITLIPVFGEPDLYVSADGQYVT